MLGVSQYSCICNVRWKSVFLYLHC